MQQRATISFRHLIARSVDIIELPLDNRIIPDHDRRTAFTSQTLGRAFFRPRDLKDSKRINQCEIFSRFNATVSCFHFDQMAGNVNDWIFEILQQ